jgi:formylglycine-generating enzyme required for sulfatase activity
MGSAPDDPLRKPGEKPNTPTYVAAFCVDLYEYPNQPGAAPKTNVGWQDAKQACESVGKRLCTEPEWERACKGPANQRFPYGNEFNPNVCATQTADGQKRNVAGAGGWAGCRSTFGIYDMSGNVREWTASPVAPGQGSYVIKGGDSDDPDWAVRCAVRLPAAPGTKSYLVGFRCCTKVNE